MCTIMHERNEDTCALSLDSARSYALAETWDNNTLLFPPFFSRRKYRKFPIDIISFFNFFALFLFLNLSLDFENQGKNAGNVTKHAATYSYFALRKSTCRQIKSSSFSNPKFNQELCISESLSTRSYRRTTQSFDSVCAFTSHKQGQLGTKTKIRVTHVHIAKTKLK